MMSAVGCSPSEKQRKKLFKKMVLTEKKTKASNQSATKVDDYYNEAVWPVLAFAQIFAIMPVSGLRENNPKFKWFTLSVIFSLCYIVVVYTLAFLRGRQTFNGKVNTSNSGGIIFFISIILSFHLFFIMARKWSKLVSNWREKEEIFLYSPYKRHGRLYLRWKIRVIAAFFLGLAFLEHAIFWTQCVSNYNSKVIQCTDGQVKDRLKHFFRTEFNHVFSTFEFNTFLAIFVTWFNVVMAIFWNYSDIFIIMVGIGLSTRFKQLNNRIFSFSSMGTDSSMWSEIRQHYVLLCELLEIVDKNLAPLILLSCANNLYFICFQLVNIFDELPSVLNYIYFWYSLMVLIGRTIVMFLCMSEIHDASQKPLEMVRAIQSKMWCTELERFSDQLTNETIALSGMKFFFITRKLLLCMVGTIITYELVLLQFDTQLDPDTIKKDIMEFCKK